MIDFGIAHDSSICFKGLNSHDFHILGDGHQPNKKGFIPITRIPVIKVRMSIPNLRSWSTFAHRENISCFSTRQMNSCRLPQSSISCDKPCYVLRRTWRLDGVLRMWDCQPWFLCRVFGHFRCRALWFLIQAAGGSSELLEHVRAKLEEPPGRDELQSERKLYDIRDHAIILCLWAWHNLLDDTTFQTKFPWSAVLSSSR